MYQSRLHATNGIISVALDALSGEVLEFVRESTWDNMTKNHVRQTWSLFDAVVHTEDGDVRLHAPRYLDIRADQSLTPVIEIDQREKSALIKITFPGLVLHIPREAVVTKASYGIVPVDTKIGVPVKMSACISIELPENECRSIWHMSLTNETDWEVETVAFPAIDGMWLGETWEDDVLVFPRHSGWQVVNPVQKLAAAPQRITWKWQEYTYTRQLNEATGVLDDRGAYVYKMQYSGPASMMWMDLYDPNEKTGLYITCRTSGEHMMGLRAESFGETNPGMGMAILHETCLEKGTWESEECVFAFHEGDWHWAADDYRTWFQSVHAPVPQNHRPQWFMESAGLMAHYDFQYQGGGIVHIELAEHFLKLVVGKASDQQLLLVGLHFHKGLRCQLLGKQPKHQGDLCLLQVCKHRRNIRWVHGDQNIPQSRIFLFLQHSGQSFGHNFKPFCHRCSSFLIMRQHRQKSAESTHGLLPTSAGYIATTARIHSVLSFP